MKGEGTIIAVKTQRFGEIRIAEEKIITMRSGILGFEHLTRYVILVQNEKVPLRWFQSLDDPAVAFIVVDPLLVRPEYQPEVDDGDSESLGITTPEEVAVLAVVTIRPRPFSMSVNLRAPIVVNVAKRTASQIVLHDSSYPVHYDCTDRDRWGLDRAPTGSALAPLPCATLTGGDDRLKPCR